MIYCDHIILAFSRMEMLTNQIGQLDTLEMCGSSDSSTREPSSSSSSSRIIMTRKLSLGVCTADGWQDYGLDSVTFS